jgi:hypothetical protein
MEFLERDEHSLILIVKSAKMNSEILKNTFRNNGLGEYNDDVFEYPVFSLKGKRYEFKLTPGLQTKFWRFGLALSNTESFHFDPSYGRYSALELKFIEVDVGEKNNGRWEFPKRLQLSTYYIDVEDAILSRCSTYQEYSSVILTIQLEIGSGNIVVSYSSDGCELYSKTLPVSGFDYFKIFAWADETEFEIDVEIRTSALLDNELVDDSEVVEQPRGYWILKLKTETWDIKHFKRGQRLWHGSHTARGIRRPEYDEYTKIKKGDRILGLAFGGFQAVVCAFEVDESLHTDAEKGEIIWIRITDIFNPYIQQNLFIGGILVDDRFQGKSAVRLIKIEQKTNIAIEDKDYNIPSMDLSLNETKYLEILYRNLIQGTEVESTYSMPELWNDFPPEFKPEAMSQMFVGGGRDITLLGVCQIYPESTLFFEFERVLYSIKKILSSGTVPKTIEQREIQTSIPRINGQIILQVFKLMWPFNSLHKGVAKRQDGSFSITLNDNAVYEQYRTFNGLKLFMHRYLARNGILYSLKDRNGFQLGPIRKSSLEYFRTHGLRRRRSEFTPILGVVALAEDLGEMIHDLPDEKGQMIGIFGRWGRGKTFLLDELWKAMQKKWRTVYTRVEYHAWKYQETPASWAYLYELLADEYLGQNRKGNLIQYRLKLLRLNIKRIGWLPVIKFGLAFVTTLLWVIFSPIYSGLAWYILVGSDTILIFSLLSLVQYIDKKFSTEATELIKKYTIRHSFKASMGIQADIQEELIILLRVWIPDPQEVPRKILLIVEDMDRCTEDRIIQNIDALRVMLEDEEISKRLVIVTAIDERILKSAIYSKYKSLRPNETKTNTSKSKATSNSNDPGSVDIKELVSEYIDKLFISAIKLGFLSAEQKTEYLKELFRNDVLPVQLLDVSETVSDFDSAALQLSSSVDTTRSEDDSPSISGSNNRDGAVITILEEVAPDGAKKTNTWQKLTPDEVSLLVEVVNDWAAATPRRISIFYYRYLLCKNLLINRYEAAGVRNNWDDVGSVRSIILLIKHYSNSYDPEAISREKDRVQNLTERTIAIPEFSEDYPRLRCNRHYLI